MADIEAELRLLRAEIEKLAGRTGWHLPMAMKFGRAAKELDVSVKTLRRMVKSQEILTVSIGKRDEIPSCEIIRLATPKARTARAEKNTKARNAKGYAAEISAALRRRR